MVVGGSKMQSADVSRKAEFARLYVQCMQALSAYWMQHLHQSDVAVLQFILERTLRWGKYREAIPYRHFETGVRTSDGAAVQCGLGISRRSIIYAVQRLEYNRLIAVTRSHSSYVGYVTNVFEINFNMLLGRDMSLLREPKRLRQRITPCATVALPHVQPLHKASANPAPHNIHKGKGTEGRSDRKTMPTAGAFGTVAEALAVVKGRGDAHRAAKAAKLNVALTHGAVLAAWSQTMLRYFPTVPVTNLTVKDFGIFKKSLQLNLRTVDVGEFFEWVISGWTDMRAGRLAFMNRKHELLPLAPRLDVLAKYLRVFARAYADHKAEQALNTRRATPSREQELERQLADAQAQLAREASEKRQAVATADRLRRIRPPRAAEATPRPLSNAVMQEASKLYADEEELPWQER